MPLKLDNTISGSSANTGKAVIRLRKGQKTDPSLTLPLETDLTTPDGLRKLNESLEQAEIRLRKVEEMEVGLAVKFGFGSLDAITSTAKPIPGAKVTLDKIGTWLILATFDWDADGAAEVQGFAVVDPETEDTAKKQDAEAKAQLTSAQKQTSTAWCLFTATQIPRLVQLYAKQVAGAGAVDVIEEGTSICALWVGRWASGDKRFGRHIESRYAGAEDMAGNTLTNHGEEARWPYSDNPDTISHGVDNASL